MTTTSTRNVILALILVLALAVLARAFGAESRRCYPTECRWSLDSHSDLIAVDARCYIPGFFPRTIRLDGDSDFSHLLCSCCPTSGGAP